MLPHDFEPLAAVRDRSELARRYRVPEQVLRVPGDATLRLVAHPKRVAVPFGEGLPGHEDARRIAARCRQEERDQLWGLALEPLDVRDSEGGAVDWPGGFDVPATAEGIRGFSRTVGPFHYALFPDDGSWVLMALLRDTYPRLPSGHELVLDAAWATLPASA